MGGFVLDLVIAVSVLLIVGVLAMLAWGFGAGLTMAMRGEDATTLAPGQFMPGLEAQVWIGLAATAVAALAVYFWRGRADASERARSRQAATRLSTWGTALGTGLAVFAFSACVAWLGRSVGIEPEPTNLAPLEALFDRPVLLLVLVAVLAPAYEELLFRRVLFGRLWRGGRPWLGLVLSSLVFATFHEMPGLSANAWPALAMLLLVYGGMGAAFAWVYWRCGTLWAPIVAHATNNFIAASLLLAGAG
ncbi:MAG: hypothetical protein A2579_13535 [Lysobacterales bacterium RIFOXYD1_FULL_69_11]|nr:MAG: hypothetical protein A2190_08170 [Xanthomonadales bacterium RIFOXYA1_FULL_69_10]OHE86097.1 MAG: hypothetical protein A2579_13535 [Xanthomonadales bacterium RIFOXYD1_FULL_69_11]